MYDYLAPLIRKKPDHIIIYTGSNDAPDKDSDEILEEISYANVYFSCPIYRFDNVKAGMALKHKIKYFFNEMVIIVV